MTQPEIRKQHSTKNEITELGAARKPELAIAKTDKLIEMVDGA